MRIASLALLLVVLVTAACESVPTGCGRPNPAGGPPVLDTREAEACDYSRVLMLDYLNELDDGEVGLRIVEASSDWDDATDRAELATLLSEDVGAEFAATIDQVVNHVLRSSRSPYRGAGPDHERDVVQAAVHGLRIGLDESYVPDVGVLGTDYDS